MVPFAQNVRMRQQALGLTRAEVARRAGLSEARYGNYARGDREPDLLSIVKLSRALEATPGQLLGTEPLPAGPQAEKTREGLLEELAETGRRLDDRTLALAAEMLQVLLAHQE